MIISPPLKTESFGYANTYISKVKHTDLLAGLKETYASTNALLAGLSNEQLNYRYAPGKWNLKEMLGHIIDTERVFAYRALRFARKDKTILPGFDENLFADSSNANERDIKALLEEFYFVRQSTIAFFSGLKEEALDYIGTASKIELPVRAVGYIILGHEIHHVGVIKERYLNASQAS